MTIVFILTMNYVRLNYGDLTISFKLNNWNNGYKR